MHIAPVRGAERSFIKADYSLLMSKENQKTTSDFDALDPTGCGTQRPLRALGGTRVLLTAAPTAPPCVPLFVAMRHLPPAGGSLLPQAAVVAAARKGLLAPFRPQRSSRNGKKLSRFARSFFLVSPIYGFAEGVTSLLTVKFSESLKSSAKP